MGIRPQSGLVASPPVPTASKIEGGSERFTHPTKQNVWRTGAKSFRRRLRSETGVKQVPVAVSNLRSPPYSENVAWDWSTFSRQSRARTLLARPHRPEQPTRDHRHFDRAPDSAYTFAQRAAPARLPSTGCYKVK